MENKKEKEPSGKQVAENLGSPRAIASDNDSAHGQGLQSTRSNKKGGPPASAYHNVARLNNQQITSGVLGNRHGTLTSAKRESAAKQSISPAKQSDEVQKIISTSIRLKAENKKEAGGSKFGDPYKQGKNSEDHSSLFIQNSPRQSKGTKEVTGQYSVQHQNGSITPISPISTLAVNRRPGANQSNLQGHEQDGSHLGDVNKRMNPIFYQGRDEDSEQQLSAEQLQVNNPYLNSSGGGITSPRFANRLNTHHATKRPKGLMPESTDTKKWDSPNQGSMIQSRTGTYAHLGEINSGSAQQIKGEIMGAQRTKQVNSMIEGKLFSGGSPKKQTIVELRSQSPVQTQKGPEIGQSSTYSAAGEKYSLFNSAKEVKVDISSYKASSNPNTTPNAPNGPNEPQFGYSQYDNPFNVQSFLPKPDHVRSEARQEKEIVKQRLQPSETDAASQQRNPTKVEVFKVYDLIKGEAGYNKHRRGASPRAHNTSKSEREASENLIKQVMRQPKVTNYEQLKRHKPSADNSSPTQTAPDSGTARNQVLYSQRDTLSNQHDLIASQGHPASFMQSRRAMGTTAQTQRHHQDDTIQHLYHLDHRVTGGQGANPHTMTQQGFRRMPMNKKMVSHHQRLASQGTTPRPPMMPTNPSTPSRASKRFVGGFGGVGSVYTHSHLTQTRKTSHYRVNSTHEGVSNAPAHAQRWPMQISNEQRLKSQETARIHNKSPGQANSSMDSVDLVVAGNRTGSQGQINAYVNEQAAFNSAAPGSLYQASGQNPQNLSQLESEPGDIPSLPQTSRSPVPIDPETYKDMHKFLPRRMDTSANELQKGQSREVSQHGRSNSMSSNEQAQMNADISPFTQVKPFIMSPQNLQDTLRKQQEAIRAEKESSNVTTISGPKSGNRTQTNSQIRNVYTQHGKRSKGSQHRLQGFSNHQPHTSSIGLSVETVQNNLAAKRLAPSTQHYSSSQITRLNQEQQTSQPSVVNALPLIEGKKMNGTIMPANINADHLTKSRKAGLVSDNSDAKVGFDENIAVGTVVGTVTSQRQGLVSTESFEPENQPKDVGMRISKVNIAVKTQARNENNDQDQNQQFDAPIDSRGLKNYSNMTNFEQNQKGGILDRQGTLLPQSEVSQQDGSSPKKRKFMPVLKSKSYLNSQTELPSPPDTSNLEAGQVINYVDEPSLPQTRNIDTVNSKEQDQEFFQMKDNNQFDENNEQNLQIQELCQQQVSSTTNRDHSDLDQGSRSLIGETAMEEKLLPTYQTKSDMGISKNADVEIEQSYLRNAKRSSHASGDTSQIDEAALQNMLRIDANALAQCQKKDFGGLDFVALKTQEFLHFQKKLGELDHNSLNSDRKATVENKADILMKDIALSARKKYSRLVGGDGQELFDINQRKNMQIKCQVPVNMIKFKNKSEQQRYTRIASCILALNDKTQQKSQNDIEFTYMKIFRFLADMLTPEEFDELSYFHVSRFIGNILRLAFEESGETISSERVLNPVSLHQFVCESLELRYRRTVESHALLQKANKTNLNFQRDQMPVYWTRHADPDRVDLYKIYSQRTFASKNQRPLGGNSETRHQQIQDQITKQVKSFAHEPRLQNVIRSTYFKQKETIKRENLARLLKSSKQQSDLNYNSLSKESTIARNKIVAEHVAAGRNMREWKYSVMAEIHDERRRELASEQTAHRKTKSQHMPRRAAITHRIY